MANKTQAASAAALLGKLGARARWKDSTAVERVDHARKMAMARWGKVKGRRRVRDAARDDELTG